MSSLNKIVWEKFEQKQQSTVDGDGDEITYAQLLIPSSVGMVPKNPIDDIADQFEFWIGHTDFDIDITTANIIAEIPGVETLDIYTRYRFRISFGKVFDDTKVKKEIEYQLGLVVFHDLEDEHPFVLTEEDRSNFMRAKSLLSECYKHYYVYLLPNGKIDSYGTNNAEEFNTRSELLKSVYRMVSGIVNIST